MYSHFQLAKKFLTYYVSASSGKGHGIHSPFVFDFIKNVLNDKKNYTCYREIENIRKQLLNDEKIIEVEDFGAGSSTLLSNKRSIKKIASASLKPKKFSQLLFRIVQYYKPETILELGTSLGITTAYLATANKISKVITLEGSINIAAVAQNNFNQLNIENIHLITGAFDETLPAVLDKLKHVDLAFVDGNHRKTPTLQYFRQLLHKATDQSIFIFDDIHWSAEMEEAWKEIRQHPSVTLTIDLFFIGVIFFKKDFKAKQDFIIRF